MTHLRAYQLNLGEIQLESWAIPGHQRAPESYNRGDQNHYTAK